MIRNIFTPDKPTISLEIPESYIGKEIEVIAFEKNEAISTEQPSSKKTSFTILHVERKDYRFNREEANER